MERRAFLANHYTPGQLGRLMAFSILMFGVPIGFALGVWLSVWLLG